MNRLLAAALLLAYQSATAADEDFQISAWEPLFRGVEMTRGTRTTSAGPEAVIGLRPDLQSEGLRFFATEDNGDAPLETDGETAGQFLKRHQLQLAINTAFFSPCCRYLGSEPLDLIGFAVSQGKQISSWSSAKPVAITISRDHQVALVRSEPEPIDSLWFACAGMELLHQGRPVTGQNDNRHPRTAAGVTRNGRHLILLIIDGRQPKHSIGASLHDTARWLIALGAHDGINLDGGGSTILVTEGGLGGAKILNRPSAGLPRVNDAHLGVFAKPLP